MLCKGTSCPSYYMLLRGNKTTDVFDFRQHEQESPYYSVDQSAQRPTCLPAHHFLVFCVRMLYTFILDSLLETVWTAFTVVNQFHSDRTHFLYLFTAAQHFFLYKVSSSLFQRPQVAGAPSAHHLQACICRSTYCCTSMIISP